MSIVKINKIEEETSNIKVAYMEGGSKVVFLTHRNEEERPIEGEMAHITVYNKITEDYCDPESGNWSVETTHSELASCPMVRYNEEWVKFFIEGLASQIEKWEMEDGYDCYIAFEKHKGQLEKTWNV